MYWQAVKFPVNSFFCLKYLPVWGRSTPSMCDDIRAWKSAIQKNKRFIGELESFNIFYIKLYEITSRKMYIGHQKFPFFTVNEITKDEIFSDAVVTISNVIVVFEGGKIKMKWKLRVCQNNYCRLLVNNKEAN